MHNSKISKSELPKSNNISRPKDIDGLFHEIEQKKVYLASEKNRRDVINLLRDIPGGSESLSPYILQEVCEYAITHRAEIVKAIEKNGVFERERPVDAQGNKDLESRRFVIARDDQTGELYFFITPKSKRADGTKYAHETDEDRRIEYNHGAFSETKLAYDILGNKTEQNIQPFVEIVPRKDDQNSRKSSHTSPLSQEINQKLAQSEDAVTRTLNVQISRNDEEHTVKFAPYRPRTFLDILYDDNISKEEKLVYFDRLVASVEKLHAQGLVHLDIKPDNIFIDYMGNISLGDLDTVTKIGETIDTPNSIGTTIYMSPELMLDNLLRLSKKMDNFPINEMFELLEDKLSSGYSYTKAIENFNHNSNMQLLNVSAEQDNWSLGIMLREIILSNENVIRMDMVDLNDKGISIDKIDEKYKDLLAVSDQLLQNPKNAKPLFEVRQEIQSHLQKNLVKINDNASAVAGHNKDVPISEFIKDKTIADWDKIAAEIQKMPLENQNKDIVNKILSNKDVTSISKNALAKINEIVKSNGNIRTTLSDIDANLINSLQIIRNAAEYVQPNTTSAFLPWNLSHSVGRSKDSDGLQKEQIRQSIYEYETRIRASTSQSNSSFRRNVQKR